MCIFSQRVQYTLMKNQVFISISLELQITRKSLFIEHITNYLRSSVGMCKLVKINYSNHRIFCRHRKITRFGLNNRKAHLYITSYLMRLQQYLYELLFESSSLYKLIFRNIAIFASFTIFALYNEVSQTFRSKVLSA